LGVDHPNVLHTNGEIVVDSFLHLLEAIASGENLDAEERRLVEDLVGQCVAP
jgi:hypothetical protein